MPFVLQFPAGTALDVHLEQGAGHGVETGRKHDSIEVVGFFTGLDASPCYRHYWCLIYVYQIDVVPIEGFKITAVDANSFGPNGVTCGRQSFSHFLICYNSVDFVAYELSCGVVDFRFGHHVPVGSE